jgi:hypothetical protein
MYLQALWLTGNNNLEAAVTWLAGVLEERFLVRIVLPSVKKLTSV